MRKNVTNKRQGKINGRVADIAKKKIDPIFKPIESFSTTILI